jgi:hypothetical protein
MDFSYIHNKLCSVVGASLSKAANNTTSSVYTTALIVTFYDKYKYTINSIVNTANTILCQVFTWVMIL